MKLFLQYQKCRPQIFILLLLCSPIFLFAQSGWTWMHGSNTGNSLGNFGTQGVAALTNDPPALYGPCSWTDLQGNFWILGGVQQVTVEYTALWKYDPSTNMWTWMKGPMLPMQAGVYGTQGIPSPGNYPGARGWGSFNWTDASGNLWLFGGTGYDANANEGILSDLWKYDIATNEWTWMAGSNTINFVGNWGTKQVAATTNAPPGRAESTAAWTSNNGELWMYAGRDNGQGYNDVWKYSPATNLWTWMAGTAGRGAVNTNWGTQQVAAATNDPGMRSVWARWKDQVGNLWLYGSSLNTSDIWKFDITTNIWTWMAGSWNSSYPGSFTQQCIAGNGIPKGRYESRAAWTDDCGRFWNYGGSGSSDLWIFDPNTSQFTWVAGSLANNTTGNYGTMQVSSPTNSPPSLSGAVSFKDQQGHFWMFGGNGSGANYHNALWRYIPDPTCSPASSAITLTSAAGTDAQLLCINTPITTITYSITGSGTGATVTGLPAGVTGTFAGGIFTINGTSTAAGTFNYTVNTTGTCLQTSASGTITFTSTDNASFSYSQSTFCQTGANPSPTVTGLTGGTFSSTAGLSINATTGEIDVAASTLGTYTVTYTTNGTCSNTGTFNVTITLTPDATFSYTGPYCQNATQDPSPVFPVGASAGVFSATPAGLVFINTITGQIDLAASAPGTYTVTNSIAASGGCAAASADNTVTVNTAPVLTISNPVAVCNPTTVNLTAAPVTTGSTGSGTLSYWIDFAATNALVSPDAVAVSGIYYIQSTTAAGCSDIEPVTVTINPAPVLVITNPAAVCSPGTVDITAAAVTAGSTGGGTLSYWTDAAATNALASPNALAVSGIYYIQSATAAGCSDIEHVTVTVNPAPVLAITNPVAVCSPVTVDITAAAVTAGSTGGGTLSYWTDAAATNALASSNALAVSGIYYIQSTTTEGCSDIEPVTVTIHPLPTPVVTPAVASICSGTGTSLTASGASTYSWSPAAGLSSTNGATVSANPAITTTYTVTGTDTNTCVNTTTVTVTVQPLPILSVASDSICEGENTMIDAIASGGTAPYAYLWNPGAMTGATVNVSPSVTTTYTVVMSDANNCFSSPQLATVTVFPNPVANFEMIPPDYAPVSNPLILFTDQSTGADHWLWNFGDILNSLSTLKDPSFTFADKGMYHVTLVVTNNEGCTDSVSHTIIIESDFNIYIPSAFTPDNDGLNDFFAPQGTEFNSFEMEIYNRWGEKIYDTEALPNPSRGEGQWDGTISGKDSAPQGVYVYKIWVKDFMGEMHYYVGNVTLVR